MIRGLSNRRSKRITIKFAEVKAITFMALTNMPRAVTFTEDIWDKARGIGNDTNTYVTYRMCLESLHELCEQGMVSHVGSVDGGYFWWSHERLV